MGDGWGKVCQGCLEQKHHPEKTVVKSRNYLSTHERSQDTGRSLFLPEGLMAKAQPHTASQSFGLEVRLLVSPPQRFIKETAP